MVQSNSLTQKALSVVLCSSSLFESTLPLITAKSVKTYLLNNTYKNRTTNSIAWLDGDLGEGRSAKDGWCTEGLPLPEPHNSVNLSLRVVENRF